MLADLVDVDRVLSHTAPKTAAEAEANINNQAWQQAMEAELKSMAEFGVWKLVPPLLVCALLAISGCLR